MRMSKRRSLADVREEMRAVVRGEREPSARPAAALMSALSAEALELLSLIWRERPKTIGEVAELTGRAQPNVSRSLQQLAQLGLVRLHRDGREVRPEPLVRTLELDLMTATYETKIAEAAG